MPPSVSFVVPFLDEEATLRELFERIRAHCEASRVMRMPPASSRGATMTLPGSLGLSIPR